MNATMAFIFAGLIILALLAFGGPTKAEEAGSAYGTITGHRPAGMILAQATPRYYDQQLLNYKYTEFCAAVKKPPKRLAEGINGAHAADPKGGWEYEIEWFNRIVEKYAEAKCGDA